MSPPTVHSQLQEQVIATERALAESMARRDHAAFTSYISDEAMFFSDTTVHRGRAAIAAAWAPLFEGKTAPFSWTPGQVEVLNSGQLALSTGPVLDARGKLVGTFTSIWRREPTGDWRIVFDKGNDVCPICGGSR
ncbi:MAG: nuclear transport factor 2 family protein [Sterolibacterium sp.]